MLHDRRELIGRVADALVVRDRHATICTAVFEPFFICSVGFEQIVMPFNN